MTITKTIRAIVTEQKLPALGSDDDGVSISKAAQWLAMQGRSRKEPVVLDAEGLRYICETTCMVHDFFDFTWGTKTGGQIQSNKDWGPYDTADAARNRCHLNMQAGDKAKIGHPFTITGPHSDMEPNKSPGYVLEQQCGIWFQSVTEIEAIGQDIDHVWGDFIDIGFLARDDRRTENAKIIPGKWNRCGRVAFNAGGTAANVEFSGDGTDGSYIKRCPGDIYHCEIQGVGGFIDWNIHDLMVYGHLRGHITGMDHAQNIRVHNNVSTGHCFLQISNLEPGTRVEGIVAIQDNHWAESGDVCLLYACDLAVITGNVGPISKQKQLVSQAMPPDQPTTATMRFGNCKQVTTSPNDFTRV